MKKNIVLEFNPLANDIKFGEVKKESAEVIETSDMIYPADQLIKYVDTANNRLIYLSNIDKPTQMQLSDLKMLSRSVALKNMFKFERTKPKMDLMTMMPYLIILLLILFK